jgi:hypothetical protein
MTSQPYASGMAQRRCHGQSKRRNNRWGAFYHSHWWCCIAVLFILNLPQALCNTRQDLQRFSIDYKNPSLHWMTRLQGEQLSQGNAIVQSPYNPNILYVTTHSGTLVALSLSNGSVITSVSLPSRVITEDSGTETWTLHCNSGISFGELHGGGKFLVYSVQDTPPEDSVYSPKT